MELFTKMKKILFSTVLVLCLWASTSFGLQLKVTGSQVVFDPGNRAFLDLTNNGCDHPTVSEGILNLDQLGAIAIQVGPTAAAEFSTCESSSLDARNYSQFSDLSLGFGFYNSDLLQAAGVIETWLVDKNDVETSAANHILKKRNMGNTGNAHGGIMRVGYFTAPDSLQAGEVTTGSKVEIFGDWRISETDYSTGSLNLSYAGNLSANNSLGIMEVAVVHLPFGTDPGGGVGATRILRRFRVQGTGSPISIHVPFEIN